MKDYYKILGVEFGANKNKIKRAYRRLAFRYHPDKNPTDEAQSKFIKATEAYEVLIDESKRKRYDILYESYLIKNEQFESPNNYRQEESNWEKYGRYKAEKYASLNFNKFAKNAFTEAKIGLSYIPNLVAILIVGIILLALTMILPNSFSSSNIGGILLLILVCSIGYLEFNLINVLISDYKEERNRNFNK